MQRFSPVACAVLMQWPRLVTVASPSNMSVKVLGRPGRLDVEGHVGPPGLVLTILKKLLLSSAFFFFFLASFKDFFQHPSQFDVIYFSFLLFLYFSAQAVLYCLHN